MRRLLPLLVLLAAAPALAESPPPRDALAAIRHAGELRWGADAQGGAPYVFQDPMDPNHLVGFEVDLSMALAKRLQLKARPVFGQWDKLLDLLQRGDFDIALNGIEVAEEKRRVCLLTHPYFVAEEKLTVRRADGNAPRTLEALKGRKVGTLPNSLAERILTRAGAEVRTYDGGQNEIYEDLRLGRTDAVLLDGPIAKFYGDIEPELETVAGSFGEVSYAIAVPLGDEALLEELNGGLDALAKDGTLAAIYARWGLSNEKTSALVGGTRAGMADEYERWRAAVGKLPPFWERVRTRYPQTITLFMTGAALTLALSVLAMGLAVALGLLLAIGRRYGPSPLRWLCTGYVEFFRGTPLLIQLTMVYFGL
ncbi:MAG: ABC transporter substrate-binding protein, partial [Myxococcaceae bacterium]